MPGKYFTFSLPGGGSPFCPPSIVPLVRNSGVTDGEGEPPPWQTKCKNWAS